MAAAPVNSTPQAQPESPSEKLKHTSSPSITSKLDGATANGVDSIDNPYFKELQRFVGQREAWRIHTREPCVRFCTRHGVNSILHRNLRNTVKKLVSHHDLSFSPVSLITYIALYRMRPLKSMLLLRRIPENPSMS
jgi:hypothetical protein